ncbi:MAG: 2-oxoglutarate dehydrogenase complex dihydrolipoyllysine-residue succinyltransferase [Alphaproteobacteria bacterium]
MVEIVVPTLGESVTEATVAQWMKKVGEEVARDEILVELETDKVAVEIPAPAAGVLREIIADVGTDVEVGGILAVIEEGASGTKSSGNGAGNEKAKDEAKTEAKPEAKDEPEAKPEAKAEAPKPEAKADAKPEAKTAPAKPAADVPLLPAVRRMVEELDLNPADIPATGRGGRLMKEDVQAYVAKLRTAKPAAAAPGKAAKPAAPPREGPRPEAAREEVVKMTRLRRRIAERLKEAQDTAAMLTTTNEADMSAVMAARSTYRDVFERKHGVRLGFMSFFVRACVLALQELPAVNAEIEDENLIYKNYYNVGVAVGTPQGLVVPVLKDADTMSFADIERTINDFGRRAREGKLTIDEMQGGTFTISNGGVYGSLLSMPILNPPQSAILGMHKIQQRAMVMADGKIEARPMMYLALSYDHRIIDGREAVTFLVRVKEYIEEPERLLLGI